MVREPRAVALWRRTMTPAIGHAGSHPHLKHPDPECFDCAERAHRSGSTFSSGRGRISGHPDAVKAFAEIVLRCPMRREYADRLAKVWW